ncbi:MAG: Na(+)/H(+) antiporter subunit B [Pelagibacterium sp. SCN 64-44]|nr:MAG: Na(+)/H(+) antiporter subunit B [Pelagibacterium sp. SCN 64-44]
MNSLIFTSSARILFVLMLGASAFILWRGHDEPGGGFVGGLVAAMAFSVIALADGVPRARALLRVHPMGLAGLGVFLGFFSGLPGLWADGTFLAHQWVFFPNGFKLGTTLVFDIGVYLVVLGGMLALVFRLYEDAP